MVSNSEYTFIRKIYNTKGKSNLDSKNNYFTANHFDLCILTFNFHNHNN